MIQVLRRGKTQGQNQNIEPWPSTRLLRMGTMLDHDSCARMTWMSKSLGDNGFTAVHKATQKGHETTIKLLLDHGASVTATYCDNPTALPIATENDNKAAIKLPLDRGVNIATTAGLERTLLDITTAYGCKAIERLLVVDTK